MSAARILPSTTSRGGYAAHHSMDFVPASVRLRPLRDNLIVEPVDVVYSRILIVKVDSKPLRGVVRAVGPGHYPIRYQDKWGDYIPDHDRKRRQKMAAGTHFVPTECKIGDIVHLGGLAIGGYAFEQFFWGDRVHLHCREADVCGIETKA